MYLFFATFRLSDLNDNLATIRQFCLVRKFRARALEIKNQKVSKKGKKGIVVKKKRYRSIMLYQKLQGASDEALHEIIENVSEEMRSELDQKNATKIAVAEGLIGGSFTNALRRRLYTSKVSTFP